MAMAFSMRGHLPSSQASSKINSWSWRIRAGCPNVANFNVALMDHMAQRGMLLSFVAGTVHRPLFASDG